MADKKIRYYSYYVIALILIDRLKESRPEYFVKGRFPTETIYTFFLVSLLIARKFIYDPRSLGTTYRIEWQKIKTHGSGHCRYKRVSVKQPSYNSYFARIAYMPIGFLNEREIIFLKDIKYKVFVSPEEFHRKVDDIMDWNVH